MYVILVYDVAQKRVSKVCKLLRRYLTWVQNSVFEGEITVGQLARLKHEIKETINEGKDAFMVYQLRDDRFLERERLGCQVDMRENIL